MNAPIGTGSPAGIAAPTANASAANASAPGGDLPGGRDPETPEEAAKQFEKVLVRRFVKVMTKDMFSNSLSGEDGPGWMKSQRGNQRDMMTDMLTDHLVESDALGISERLTKQWGGAPAKTPSTPALQQPVDPLPASPDASLPDASSTHEGPRLDRTA